MIRFTDPIYLLLLIPVVAGLVYSFRFVHGMAKARKRFAFFVRFVLASLLVVSLAGPEARRPNQGIATIFVLDHSDSVSEKDRARAEKFVDTAMQKLGPNDVAGLITFGKDATIDASPGGRRQLGQILSKNDGSASDLASALRLANASFPDGRAKRIVLLSDANETTGDAAEVAQVASTDGVQIDNVALGLEDHGAEASVVAMETPEELRVDQPFDMRVVVDSTGPADATIIVDRDGVVVKQVPVRLQEGRSAFIVQDILKKAGFYNYRATLKTRSDTDVRNNVGIAFANVRGRPRVLVLQEDTTRAVLVDALRKSGLAVDLGGVGSVPTRPEQLQAYDAVVFNDINASGVTVAQMKNLQAAVRDSGIGFAMIGGENSFLPGGYYGTPIAEILPVDLNIRQRKSFPSTSILIMADASGSMSMMEDGVQKIRLAARAAEETVKLMSPMDRVGVAGSTDGIEFVAPMQPLTDKAAVIEQIRKLSTGGGGIYIRPSMEKAEEVLKNEPSKVRHFILLADGNDSDEQGGSIEIALRMRANKITTSVVAIGDGKDVKFLQRLAAAGGGRYYIAKTASQLPAIFTQDAAIMSRSAIEEGAFLPKMAAGEEILRGIDSTPPLLAYCLTDSRPLSRIGMKTAKDDPLLASWQYGLGTVVAFTSDAQNRWASRWVGWEGFSTFWSQAIRSISRRATLNDYQVAVRYEGGKGVVDVKAYDRLGNPLSSTNAKIRVATPQGGSADVPLTQMAPGQFKGTFEASELGSYIVTVAEQDPKGGQRVSVTGFSLPYPPEYRSFRVNKPLLQQMADLTKGKGLKTPEESLRPVANPGASITELWPFLMLFAAILLPFDVGVRRIALPLGEMIAKALAWMRIRRATRNVPTNEGTVGRLQQAKTRAQKPTTPNEAPTQTTPEPHPDPVAPRAATGGNLTAGNKLLEAKRKRQSDNDPKP